MARLEEKKESSENPPQKPLSDNELVELIRTREPERYAEIVERYQGKLFAYIYRLIREREAAEDVLQNVFIKAYKNLHSFNLDGKFSSWIYRIAHNEAVNYIKRRSLRKLISWEDISSAKDKLMANDTENGADDEWLRKEKIQEVDEAIEALPKKYKQVLMLRYFSEKSYEEIGKILKKPINTVGTLINRAKKKLSQEMAKAVGAKDKS